MSGQPGYDEVAEAYQEAFPEGFTSALERHAVAIFAADLLATGESGLVLDVGCGTGHVTRDLSLRGLEVLGVDPSRRMLRVAQRCYPGMRWIVGDATLASLGEDQIDLSGIIARFSLIHVNPRDLPAVLMGWARRLRPGAHVLIAFQCSEDPLVPVCEFDHQAARAWRWQ